MSTAEYHYLLGGYVREREKALGLSRRSVLAAAHELEVPIYTSSPGDSSIGMNVAEQALAGSKLRFDVSADVNETASIVLEAKRTGGKSGVLIVGGGSPKNFMLQTEPQIQEVLGIDERGHDYFLQMTDARPDTGGLSGATPAEAVSWGKIDPDQLPGTVVVYADNSIALPLLTAYAKAQARGPSAQAALRPPPGDDGPADPGVPGGAGVPGRAGRGVAGAHASGRRRSRDGGAAVTPSPPTRVPPTRYSWYALGLLALINLLNYIDRNVIYALFEPIKRDLALTDAQLGWLGSAYILVFSVAALPFGVLSDLRSRRAVIAGGVCSGARSLSPAALSTASASCSCAARWSGWGRRHSGARRIARGGLLPAARPRGGHGDSGRGSTLGGVVGIWLGGRLEGTYGWRVAFMAVSLPGFLLAVLVARLRDPTRARTRVRSGLASRLHVGVSSLLRHSPPVLGLIGGGVVALYFDRVYGADSKVDVAVFSGASRWDSRSTSGSGSDASPALQPRGPTPWSGRSGTGGLLAVVLRTPTLVYIFAGGAMISFGVNGLVGWAPTFMSRELELRWPRRRQCSGAGDSCRVLGALFGGVVADWLRRYTPTARVIRAALGS